MLCYCFDDPTSVDNGECMYRSQGVFVTRTSSKGGVILESDRRMPQYREPEQTKYPR
jgi:hypothetical protein